MEGGAGEDVGADEAGAATTRVGVSVSRERKEEEGGKGTHRDSSERNSRVVMLTAPGKFPPGKSVERTSVIARTCS